MKVVSEFWSCFITGYLVYQRGKQPFVKIDLHGLRQDEAIKVIDKAIKEAEPSVYQLQLIHGYHRGTSLKKNLCVRHPYRNIMDEIIS